MEKYKIRDWRCENCGNVFTASDATGCSKCGSNRLVILTNYKDGDRCPQCDSMLYEGVHSGYVVCLHCGFESPINSGWVKDDQ